jgi:hypothetical protein
MVHYHIRMGLPPDIQDTIHNFIHVPFVARQNLCIMDFDNKFKNNNTSILHVLIQHADVQTHNQYKGKSKFQTRTNDIFLSNGFGLTKGI